MRKSIFTLVALAFLSFATLPASAHDHDGLNVPVTAASAYHVDNLMPAIPEGDGITSALNSTAKYALNDVVVTLPAVIVSRDFRTIADSGGRNR